MTREDEIIDRLTKIETLLNGNGKMGFTEMARRSFEYCQQLKMSKQGTADWVFRAVILIGITYIAAQVGIK